VGWPRRCLWKPINHRAIKFTIAKVSPLRRREDRERNVLPYNL
jgi:hypothetical protein